MSLWTSPVDERGLSLSGMTLRKHPQLPTLLSLDNATYIISVVIKGFLLSLNHFAEAVLASPL